MIRGIVSRDVALYLGPKTTGCDVGRPALIDFGGIVILRLVKGYVAFSLLESNDSDSRVLIV